MRPVRPHLSRAPIAILPPVRLFLLSALLHGLIGLRLLPALASAAAGALASWLLLSAVLVPMGLMARRFARPPRSDRLATAGLFALGLFSSLFVLTVARDLLSLLAWGAGAGSPDWPRASAQAVPLLALALTALGLLNTRRTARVKQVEVPIAGLPPALHGFTIAQISDLHVGPTIRAGYIERIVERVNGLQADAVAITGDIVDGPVHELGLHVAPLAGLRSRHGSFFVTGNHEYYAGAMPWLAELRRLGIRVLLNEHVVIEHGGATLVLAGVPDYSAHHFEPAHQSDPAAALAGAPAACRRPGPAGPSAAQRQRGGAGRLRPAALGPHAWRPVLSLDLLRAPAAALHGRFAPDGPAVGLRQPGDRLLGTAQAGGGAVGDHAAEAGRGLSWAGRGPTPTQGGVPRR